MFGNNRSSSVQTEMGLNRMGVAWFHHSQGGSSHHHNSPTQASLRLLGRHPKRLRDRVEDLVDVIDIEDEDHSFAAFFIGMKNGGTGRNVKRPLVKYLKSFFFEIQFDNCNFIDFVQSLKFCKSFFGVIAHFFKTDHLKFETALF